jgi:hypothetical protein
LNVLFFNAFNKYLCIWYKNIQLLSSTRFKNILSKKWKNTSIYWTYRKVNIRSCHFNFKSIYITLFICTINRAKQIVIWVRMHYLKSHYSFIGLWMSYFISLYWYRYLLYSQLIPSSLYTCTWFYWILQHLFFIYLFAAL